jgi:hypothetical protein
MDAYEVLLAVDPSLRGTGFAVLQRSSGKIRCLHFDVIKNTAEAHCGWLPPRNPHAAQ